MAKAHHSPSRLGEECDLAWALRALDHVRDPEVSYADIEAGRVEVTPGVMRRARGVASHGILQDWFQGRTPAWESSAGRLALSGSYLLPAPSKCKHAEEFYLGDVPYEYKWKDDAGVWHVEPATVLVLDGIRILAKVDLRTWDIDPGERARLGLRTDWLTLDHKTTRDFRAGRDRNGVPYNPVKTPEQLAEDFAAGMYALDDMQETGLDVAPMRWVYYKAEGAPDARPVDFAVTRMQAEDTAARMVKRAKHLDLIPSSAEATPNFDRCDKFGGCPHHASKGGRCKAVPPLFAGIQSGPTKETNTMDPNNQQQITELQARIASLQGGTPPAPPVVVQPPPPPGVMPLGQGMPQPSPFPQQTAPVGLPVQPSPFPAAPGMAPTSIGFAPAPNAFAGMAAPLPPQGAAPLPVGLPPAPELPPPPAGDTAPKGGRGRKKGTHNATTTVSGGDAEDDGTQVTITVTGSNVEAIRAALSEFLK